MFLPAVAAPQHRTSVFVFNFKSVVKLNQLECFYLLILLLVTVGFNAHKKGQNRKGFKDTFSGIIRCVCDCLPLADCACCVRMREGDESCASD